MRSSEALINSLYEKENGGDTQEFQQVPYLFISPTFYVEGGGICNGSLLGGLESGFLLSM